MTFKKDLITQYIIIVSFFVFTIIYLLNIYRINLYFGDVTQKYLTYMLRF